MIRLGLERITAALGALDRPDGAYPSVQVAGTNGKGSACAFLESCLRAAGLRTGLFTSPHLVSLNERFRIDGEPLSDEALGDAALALFQRLPALCGSPPPLTYFEVGTLLALLAFQGHGVQLAVLETGLGGRLDATTAAEVQVTAVTSISVDHAAILGPTLAAIAGEKAGVFRAGVPAITAAQPEEVLAVLRARAAQRGAPLREEGTHFRLVAEGRDTFAYHGPSRRWSGLRLGLRGEHQVSNAAVALACLESLAEAGQVAPSLEAVREGLERTRWPGRLEEEPGPPPRVLDGAHNPAGMSALLAALAGLHPGRPLHAVFGVLADKAVDELLRLLAPACASLALVRLQGDRASEPAAQAPLARSLCRRVDLHPTVAGGLEAARSRAEQDGGLVVCAGSLRLVGEVKAQGL